MLSSPWRAICPLSARRIINMSRGASSSSVKRKRDNPGDTRPDSKAPKRASETLNQDILYSQTTRAAPCGGEGVFHLLTYSPLIPSVPYL